MVEIARQQEITLHIANNSDSGYHRYGNDWWTRMSCPYSFNYLSINALYPKAYFEGHGHPSSQAATELVEYMASVFKNLFGRDLKSVLELGCGGGEITKVLNDQGVDYLAVEGAEGGIARLREIGIPTQRIRNWNLKFMPRLDRRFDMAMCTEVAEHIEPFFASKLVENCILHADAVWFSAADRNRKAHYHHINELPVEAWDNLFAHMGFARLVELDGRHGRASRMYLRSESGVQATDPH